MSSTRFRKRDEALGAVLRDMATAKYVAADAGAPHSPKGSQVERRGQYGPLGRHVCQTSQEEPPARLLLLDNPEHRLDRLLPQLVRRFSCRGGHPSAVAPQGRVVRPNGCVAAILAFRAHAKGRARSADGSGHPVKPVMDSIGRDADTVEGERLSLGTPETVAALIVGEPILVVRILVVRMTSRLSR